MLRRKAFGAATAALGMTASEAAERLGVTYNHLVLVLAGIRTGSARLEAGTRAILDEAKPALRRIVAGDFDVPQPSEPQLPTRRIAEAGLVAAANDAKRERRRERRGRGA